MLDQTVHRRCAQGLFRSYQLARCAALVTPARIAAFSPSTVRAPSQRHPQHRSREGDGGRSAWTTEST